MFILYTIPYYHIIPYYLNELYYNIPHCNMFMWPVGPLAIAAVAFIVTQRRLLYTQALDRPLSSL